MLKTLQAYNERKTLDSKNVFLDRLVKANPDVFMEAMNMFTDGVREIFMEGAEKNGWLESYGIEIDKEKDKEKAKEIAKKMLLDGESIEKIAHWTDLPIETIKSIANELENTPAPL
jgi:predicted transposase YdaD